jgi:F-type H+-transporting ATPase subunit alpha
MTFLPIVETQQGDVTGHIPSNLISITDGQLYINANIFIEGFKPAIDFGLSVSRIGSKVQCKAMKELGGKLRLEYLQYKMQQKLTNVNASLTEEAEARMRRGEALTQIFMQDKNAPVSLEEQIVLFYGINSAVLQKMDKSGWKRFKDEVFPFLLKTRPALIQEIGTKQEMTPQIKDQLDKAFGEFLSLQIPEEEKA